MFTYDPKDAKKVFDNGEYTAELLSCEEQMSKEKPGKPAKAMLCLQWRVYSNTDHPAIVLRDYIMSPYGIPRLEMLAKSWGCEKEFANQEFNPADHRNRNVTVKLKTDENVKYGLQNVIVSYKPMKGAAKPPAITKAFQEQMKRAEADVGPTFAPDGEEPPF